MPRVPAPAVPPPRASSQPPPGTKSVQFDIDSDFSSVSSFASPHSPDKIHKRHHRSGGGQNHQNSTNDGEISPSAAKNSPRSRRRHHDRRRASQTDDIRSPSPAPSDTTVDLPDRFDRYGRRKPEKGEDLLADKFEDLLRNEAVGKFLGRLTGAFGGGSDGDGVGGRRRRRR